MKLRLLSQNVRGLNDPQAVANLRQYIHSHPVDFLFIQEHKLRGQGAANLGRLLWKKATTLHTDAEPGYSDGSPSSKGGVASIIVP